MQLKMQDLLGFTNFHESVKDKKIPIKTAYKLAKLSNAIEKEVVFYQKISNQIRRVFLLKSVIALKGYLKKRKTFYTL